MKEWPGPAHRDALDERLTEQVIWCSDNREASLGLRPLPHASMCHLRMDMCNLVRSMVAALYNPFGFRLHSGLQGNRMSG